MKTIKPKTTWNFQIIPATPDVVDVGFGSDVFMKEIGSEIDLALPAKLQFHKVNKIVIELGGELDKKEYSELLGVGVKRFQEFNLNEYNAMNDLKKAELVKQTVRNTINWLINNFDDTESFIGLKKKVSWLEN